MPDNKKIKNLGTYAIIMILSLVIIIIFAAMADDRESKFENQIYEQTQTNVAIQNEIVKLKDDNYTLSKDLEKVKAELNTNTASMNFYKVMTSAWTLYNENKLNDAAVKMAEIDSSSLNEEEKAHYEKLLKLLPKVDENKKNQ